MGQKVNPKGLRIGVIKDWDSKWYSKKDFGSLLYEDKVVRDHIRKKLGMAGISTIGIERAANRLRISIHTAKPGVVIGRGGGEVDALRKEIEDLTGRRVNINIIEIKRPELDARLVAENVASQLERRISFRRAMKQTIARSMRAGAEGVKISCSGRLGGAEMARNEWYSEGKVPLHTLRADIDYGAARAKTVYGIIGVKVWIFKGEVLPEVDGEGGD
ncbi:MAG: 30S ribosomal protein S3 [Clostridia bacterium]|nr:30S ribosomal protein S3 [Clostridia bacterium]